MSIIENKKDKIINWLKQYCNSTNNKGFVIGVSGGVDSALTSTLCALTGLEVVVVGMPIHQRQDQLLLSENHMNWLCKTFNNVKKISIDLTQTYEIFKSSCDELSELALANTRSRLRMVTLYSIANTNNLLVAGTGNKVEDYGVGFFTKYGDGGVDLSPIADLLKSEVREMARELGVSLEIVSAVPTDGLWSDSRSDEEQIGATYDELEWALKYYDEKGYNLDKLSEREINVLKIYVERHKSNKHKLEIPPVCYLYNNVKTKQKTFHNSYKKYILNLEEYFFSDYGVSESESLEIQEYKNIGDFCLNFDKDCYIVDIGANYGLASFAIASRGYNVIAFEPVSANYFLLNKSIEENDVFFDQKIKTFKFALGDKTQKQTIYVPHFRDNCSMSKESAVTNMRKSKEVTEEEIDVITFDDWLLKTKDFDEKKIKFIKSDTQGFEYSVVHGMKNFFKRNSDFYVLLEWDPLLLKNAGYNSKLLYDFMNENGFVEKRWFGNDDKLFYKENRK